MAFSTVLVQKDGREVNRLSFSNYKDAEIEFITSLNDYRDCDILLKDGEHIRISVAPERVKRTPYR